MHDDLAQERNWLARVIAVVRKQLDQAERERTDSRTKMSSLRRLIWDDLHYSGGELANTAQQIVSLQETAGSFSRYSHDLRKLTQMLEKPYFGRIDFREDGSTLTEELYIGLGSLVDQDTKEPLVYDWRAPISSLFYDYEIGRAAYSCPDGKLFGTITLKRQYKIEDGQLKYMLESSLKIDDELLQQVLSQHADEKMRNIVTSIQRDQNRAIRYETRPVLIVIGPAGSGKTSVALHRIAYLLYTHRENIDANNVLIFSPNHIFSEYISRVLPELGEENVLQTTFQDFAEGFLAYKFEVESLADELENLATEREVDSSPSWKMSEAFHQVLEERVDQLYQSGAPFRDVVFHGELVMAKREMEQLYYDSYSFLPLVGRLDKIRRRLLYLLEPIKRKRIAEEVEKLTKEQTDDQLSKWEIKRLAVETVLGQVGDLLNKVDQWLTVDYVQVYCQLFLDLESADQFNHPDLPSDWRRQGSKSLRTLQDKKIRFQDVTPLLYLKGRLEGFPRQERIRQVVLDEAQDYSPLQLAIIFNLFPKSQFTLLGDMSQSINPHLGEDALFQIPREWSTRVGHVQLTRSYRSTAEITRFCQAILGKERDVQIESVRSGEKPVLHHISSGRLSEAAKSVIDNWRGRGFRTGAVLCQSVIEAKSVYHSLQGLDQISLITSEKDKLVQGVVVIPLYLAKGLEFDCVLVWDAGQEWYTKSWQRRLLYVACSRALHTLELFHTGELSLFVRDIDKTLYITK